MIDGNEDNFYNKTHGGVHIANFLKDRRVRSNFEIRRCSIPTVLYIHDILKRSLDLDWHLYNMRNVNGIPGIFQRCIVVGHGQRYRISTSERTRIKKEENSSVVEARKFKEKSSIGLIGRVYLHRYIQTLGTGNAPFVVHGETRVVGWDQHWCEMTSIVKLTICYLTVVSCQTGRVYGVKEEEGKVLSLGRTDVAYIYTYLPAGNKHETSSGVRGADESSVNIDTACIFCQLLHLSWNQLGIELESAGAQKKREVGKGPCKTDSEEWSSCSTLFAWTSRRGRESFEYFFCQESLGLGKRMRVRLIFEERQKKQLSFSSMNQLDNENIDTSLRRKAYKATCV
ncbi:hypothetical protein KPH14_011115 [Odynerus spinipes]|uniref:Uncharacterized protein n=1 Tax=Odynerus spinipes TaxID=1348599 RepID=A0AAD9VLF5_9HYME|nr:hypothetical protein KPH14_011115 [Odynerus spinipes]